jgi:YegS/Rv2252/BmrU family lipid kinase
MKHFIILNPNAGRGSAGKRRSELERALHQAGINFDLLTTHARGGATELTYQALERGYDQVTAVGGDGTINEIVNGILGRQTRHGKQAQHTRPSLGIVPLGTGSDFIKVLDGVKPNDLAGAVRRLARGQTRAVDVAHVRARNPLQTYTRYFINGMTLGLDSQVAVESLKVNKLKGRAVYLLAILRALKNYHAHPMTVRFDGREVYRRLLFANVANGRYQGGGFRMTPDALIDDGLLDLCMVDNLRLDQIARYLPRLTKGTHTRLRQVRMDRARHVTIECSEPLPVATDGEVIVTDARYVEVEVLPGALEIVV